MIYISFYKFLYLKFRKTNMVKIKTSKYSKKEVINIEESPKKQISKNKAQKEKNIKNKNSENKMMTKRNQKKLNKNIKKINKRRRNKIKLEKIENKKIKESNTYSKIYLCVVQPNLLLKENKEQLLEVLSDYIKNKPELKKFEFNDHIKLINNLKSEEILEIKDEEVKKKKSQKKKEIKNSDNKEENSVNSDYSCEQMFTDFSDEIVMKPIIIKEDEEKDEIIDSNNNNNNPKYFIFS